MDRAKLEELYDKYIEGLIHFLMRYVKDENLAEDLAEDVFVEILLHPDRFRKASSEKTYLYAVGRNKAVDFIRRNARVSTVSIDDEELNIIMSDLSGEETEAGVEETVIKKEDSQRLGQAMGRLKEEYRTALYLSYYEEMSYTDIGAAMGKSPKQVENYIYRGKKALRGMLEEKNNRG